ncbi:MAG: hypothetical protein JXM70_26520 [Pirellulales bacterium]|nr:hypothetical protein [Pirellulales bacterium]
MGTQSNQRMSLDSVFRPVMSALNRLVVQLRDGQPTNGEVDDLWVLLETLPLSTDEFGLSCNRLCNAHRYLLAKEVGAARWELKELKLYLQTRGNGRPCET